jgi:hypothetical protein
VDQLLLTFFQLQVAVAVAITEAVVAVQVATSSLEHKL